MIRTDETGTYVWYMIHDTDTKVEVSIEHYLAIAKTSATLDERRAVFAKGTISPLTDSNRDELGIRGIAGPGFTIRAMTTGAGRKK